MGVVVVHVEELQSSDPGIIAALSRSAAACLLRRRDQNIHSIIPPSAMIPIATPTPIPAAAPVLSPLLLLSCCASPVADAMAELDVCKLSEADPEVVVVVAAPSVVVVWLF